MPTTAPTYKRPGAFVEESLTPLATNAFTPPGANSAAFVGPHFQGPTTPTQVQSWAQFVALFGGFGNGSFYLPFAVYDYFAVGGSSCYVMRVAGAGATAATQTLNNASLAAVLTLTALSPGGWGNSLYIDVVLNTATPGRFDLYIKQGGTGAANIVERWSDVSLNPADARNVVNLINSVDTGSAYVVATTPGGYAYTTNDTPSAQSGTPLASGADGTAAAATDIQNAIPGLDVVEESLDLNLPGESRQAVINAAIAYCDPALGGRGDVFLVIDCQKGRTPTQVISDTTGGSGYTASSYWAVYWPWRQVSDPMTTTPGVTRTLPPGGAMCGLYARTDTLRGVQKPAAGIQAVLPNTLGVEYRPTSTDLDNLNQAGVNVIKRVPGVGYCAYGARTGKSGFPDRYLSVRRTLIYIKKALADGSRYAVFEPNNSLLWEGLATNITQFLTTLMQVGVLKGSTPEEAFFVICDESNNTPQTVGQGEVHVDVGVALNNPAEFVVIRVSQYDGGAQTTDNTDTATAA